MPSENERLAELEALFDLRWNADRRAIQRWQSEKPEERQLTWPDHTDLCVWLLGRVEELEREVERLRGGSEPPRVGPPEETDSDLDPAVLAKFREDAQAALAAGEGEDGD